MKNWNSPEIKSLNINMTLNGSRVYFDERKTIYGIPEEIIEELIGDDSETTDTDLAS